MKYPFTNLGAKYFIFHPMFQRVFRGFRGRIFAQRWALKYAEVEALKAVLHEAATNIQKAFRGHLGRVEASEVRTMLCAVVQRKKIYRKTMAGWWLIMIKLGWVLTHVLRFYLSSRHARAHPPKVDKF